MISRVLARTQSGETNTPIERAMLVVVFAIIELFALIVVASVASMFAAILGGEHAAVIAGLIAIVLYAIGVIVSWKSPTKPARHRS